MKFTKMHGLGNDYVYVNCFEEKVDNPADTARFVSDRHFGIGSDGLILICPSREADCEMVMYNADGSRGAMCGNGIRCVAKYAYDHGIAVKETMTIAAGSGIKTLYITARDGKAEKIRVDMGSPILSPKEIPVLSDLPRIVNEPITAGHMSCRYTAISMGNPHAVIFTDHIDALDLVKTGPFFENHPLFPDRVNTEFVEVLGPRELKMRVWERGSGETLACGTGACAAAAAAILNHLVSPEAPITVHLLGGDLEIFWDQGENTIYMTGPAVEVFEGEIPLPQENRNYNALGTMR